MDLSGSKILGWVLIVGLCTAILGLVIWGSIEAAKSSEKLPAIEKGTAKPPVGASLGTEKSYAFEPDNYDIIIIAGGHAAHSGSLEPAVTNKDFSIVNARQLVLGGAEAVKANEAGPVYSLPA
jgi:hypothetical protein